MPEPAVSPTVQVRRATVHDDMEQLEALQRRIWGMEDRHLFPAQVLRAMVRFEVGLVLVAVVDGLPIGFLSALVARDGSHWSDLVGVAPEWQGGAGGVAVGRALKLLHRETARAMGVATIRWTYDPLRSRNAHLNVHRLGAVVVDHVPDLYGPVREGLYAGRPTDRVVVAWPTQGPLGGVDFEPALVPLLDGGPVPDRVRLPIPLELDALDAAAALQAQARFRADCRRALDAGLQGVGFRRDPAADRGWYLFQRDGIPR